MLYVPGNYFGWSFDNWGAANTYPSSNPGDSFTLAASGDLAGATAVQVASTSEMAYDAHLVMFSVITARSAGSDRSFIFSLGIDPAGGTSYTWVVEKVIGYPSTVANITGVGYNSHVLPLFIPAGASVAIKGATVDSSTQTAYAVFQAFGQLSRPEMFSSYGKCETLGWTSGVLGTAVSAAANPNGRTFGSWTSLGTTTFPWRAATLGFNVSGSAIAGGDYWFELGHGDGTTCTRFITKVQLYTSTNEDMIRWPREVLRDMAAVPSGATVYARQLTGTTNPPNQGAMYVTAHGVG